MADFDYTSVPFEPKNKNFYPDRIFRDEMSARNQFFQSPDFQASGYGQRLNTLKGRKRDQAKDSLVTYLNDLQLRNTPRWNPETKKHDGPMERSGGNFDFAPEDFMYLDALDKSRQKQFQKYDPFYGMSDEMIEESQLGNIEDIRKQRSIDKGYGWERPEKDRKWTDIIQGIDAGFLEGAGLFSDLAANVGKNLAPWDDTWTDRKIPKGLIDTGMYQYKKMQFENEIKEGLGIDLEEAWLDLPQEQKDALNADFKERSGYDYTVDYNPWYFEDSPVRDFTDRAFYDPADDIRSRMYLEDWDPVTIPWFDKLGGDIETSYTWPEILDVGTEFTAGWGAPATVLGKVQNVASSPLAKIPGIGNLLSKFTGAKSQTAGILGLATYLDEMEGKEKKWPDLKPEWLEWPSNDPKGILESLSKE